MDSPPTDTRSKLILAALSLFAQHGIEAVSIRQIIIKAGQSNESAVHYHFGNKDGLVVAVLDHVNQLLQPTQRDALLALQKIAEKRQPTTREIVSNGIMPFVLLYAQSSTGRKAIRFLSRLTWQSNEEGFNMLIVRLWPYYKRLEGYLIEALPDKQPSALQVHGALAVSTVLHGLADTRLLNKVPALGVSRMFEQHPWLLLEYFIDYIVGGLSCSTVSTSPPAPTPKID